MQLIFDSCVSFCRFTKDIDTVDGVVPNNIKAFIWDFLTILATLIIISISTPWFLIIVIPLGIVYVVVQVSKWIVCIGSTSLVFTTFVFNECLSVWFLLLWDNEHQISQGESYNELYFIYEHKLISITFSREGGMGFYNLIYQIGI